MPQASRGRDDLPAARTEAEAPREDDLMPVTLLEIEKLLRSAAECAHVGQAHIARRWASAAVRLLEQIAEPPAERRPVLTVVGKLQVVKGGRDGDHG